MPDGSWRPRRRLRHLKSLEARNLRNEASNDSLEGSATFYKLWQRSKHEDGEDAALTWIYTSDEVHGGISPQWAEMHLQSREDIGFDSLHSLRSDQLHLHIYSAFPPAAAGSLSNGPHSEADPCHNSDSGQQKDARPVREVTLMLGEPVQGSKGEGKPERHPHADKDALPNGATDTKWRRPDAQRLSSRRELEADSQQQDSRSHPGGCDARPGSCKLVLAADITLNGLERLPDMLDLDNRVLPANTLILGLTDGLYIWPPSLHMRRTASGAVPSIIPELTSFLDADDAGSKGSRAPQMPAIAEDPQTAVPRGPDSDSGGGARTKVAARDLEAGLRAAVQAQRSLQARRRRRDKLLRALSQAVQAKGQAQQQREQVERLREGAARHRSVAQSAQRRAAALQRSLALSQQVAVLQAQALAGACSAMLEAARRVQEAARLLEIEGRGSRLASLQRQLVALRCRLAVRYGAVYSVGPKTVSELAPPPGGFLWELMDVLWFSAYVLGGREERHAPEEASDSLDVPSSPAASEHGSYASSVSRFREVSQLTIGGLDLEPDLARKILDTDAELAAAAVGYATRLTQRLATLLDVPLRYPLRFANSRSSILSHAAPAGTIRDMLEGEAKGGHRGVFELLHLSDKTSGAGVASLSPREFPLYYGGKELKPFQYALFLLSKDVEQLLHAHGLHSTGAAQLLQNLYKLLAAAASAAGPSSSVQAASF